MYHMNIYHIHVIMWIFGWW